MSENTAESSHACTTEPDARSEPGPTSLFTPWSYIGCGGVLLAAGVLFFLVSTADGYSDVDPLIGQVVGVLVAVLGVMVALIGVVAEGVRVGTLHARSRLER